MAFGMVPDSLLLKTSATHKINEQVKYVLDTPIHHRVPAQKIRLTYRFV